jgi:DNA-binding transcriptional ArsR family regulator
MDTEIAASGLEALGSPTRLEIFRLLVRAGHGGAAVGAIQAKLKVPPSTLSHHIARLVKAGLVTQERQSRSLICRAEYAHMDALVAYLLHNCCEGLDDSGKPPRKKKK